MTRANDVPTTLTAGDGWSWRRDLRDYPATAGYVLSYAIVGPSGMLDWSPSWSVGQSDGSFLVDIPSAATASLGRGGQFQFIEMVTLAGERSTIRSRTVRVNADPAGMVEGDTIDSRRRQLAAIDAFLEGNLEDGVQYQIIGSRQMQHWPLKELVDYRDRLRREIAAEEAAAAGRTSLGRVYAYRYRGA